MPHGGNSSSSRVVYFGESSDGLVNIDRNEYTEPDQVTGPVTGSVPAVAKDAYTKSRAATRRTIPTKI